MRQSHAAHEPRINDLERAKFLQRRERSEVFRQAQWPVIYGKSKNLVAKCGMNFPSGWRQAISRPFTCAMLVAYSSAAPLPERVFSSPSIEGKSMDPTVTPFLMFEGQAQEAMTLYVSLFPNSGIGDVLRYGPEGPGREGSVLLAKFTVAGQPFLCIDSPASHAFSFTPAMSVHVACATEAEIDAAYATLSEGGQVLMPLGSYPFSARYAWLSDRFGVSWQLALAS
jgi:predicted 3-demethylubiquinone-9 3-methyltransferase (glyoxalase superfamily)